jgi:DNA mismatch endonuclease (patch repair protein)
MPARRQDPLSPDKRSEIMRAVRRQDTAPEIRLCHALWVKGLRYRKHLKIGDARPDVCFIGKRLAIFG